MNSGSVPYAATTASVTRFVVEHNTIEHLSLSKTVPRNGLFFHLDGPLIAIDILPNLRNFEGCPATLTILARRGVLSLFSLTSLSLFACEENLDDISAMVGAIKSSPAKVLASVGDLRVEFLSVEIPPVVVNPPFMEEGVHVMSSNATSMREMRCLDEIAGLCPNVVNYSGTFPAMCAVSVSSLQYLIATVLLTNCNQCTRPFSNQLLGCIVTSKRYLSHGTHYSFIWSHLGRNNISPLSRSPFLHSTPSLLANHVTRISRTKFLPSFGIPRANSVKSFVKKFDLRDPLFRGGRLVSLQLNQKASGTAPLHCPPFFAVFFILCSCFAHAFIATLLYPL